MLEQKLIVDRLVDLNARACAMPRDKPVGSFYAVPVEDCYLQESTGVFQKTSTLAQGTGPKIHRNFKWLTWLPGYISEVAPMNHDVLTGPMSGCWVVRYIKANGVPHVGHIGTDVDNAGNSTLVKTAWNHFAAANPGSIVGGVNVLRNWSGAIPPAKGNDETAPRMYTLCTTGNEFYGVVVYQQKGKPKSLVRIAAIKRMTSNLPAVLP